MHEKFYLQILFGPHWSTNRRRSSASIHAPPTTYVVDREGVVCSYHIGGGTYDRFAEMVEPYL